MEPRRGQNDNQNHRTSFKRGAGNCGRTCSETGIETCQVLEPLQPSGLSSRAGGSTGSKGILCSPFRSLWATIMPKSHFWEGTQNKPGKAVRAVLPKVWVLRPRRWLSAPWRRGVFQLCSRSLSPFRYYIFIYLCEPVHIRARSQAEPNQVAAEQCLTTRGTCEPQYRAATSSGNIERAGGTAYRPSSGNRYVCE